MTCDTMWKDVWDVKEKLEKVAVKVAVKVKEKATGAYRPLTLYALPQHPSPSL